MKSRKQAKIDGDKTYFTGKPCVNGHVVNRRTDNGCCVTCMHTRSNSYKEKHSIRLKSVRSEYINNNRKQIQDADRSYRRANRDRILEQRRNRFKADPETYRKKSREYIENNADKIRESRREYYKLYMREQRKRPETKMKSAIRSMVRRLVQKTKANISSRSETAVGYTCHQLKSHIESLFVDGMSWDNRTMWHIDHIRSIKSFLNDGITDPKIINALSNLQPLWIVDNLKKGA